MPNRQLSSQNTAKKSDTANTTRKNADRARFARAYTSSRTALLMIRLLKQTLVSALPNRPLTGGQNAGTTMVSTAYALS